MITPLEDNTIDGLSSQHQGNGAITSGGGGGGNNVGVWIGVGAGIILVLLFIIILFYLKLKRGSWIWSKGQRSDSSMTTNKRSVTMTPPNMPLPPTPQTHFSVQQPSQHLYASANEIYEHLPGENHHMYDLTYEDTQVARKRNAHVPGRPRSPPPSPPAAVTVNGFVLA